MLTMNLFVLIYLDFSSASDVTGNATTETFTDDGISGVQINQTIAGLDCTYTLATKSGVDGVEVSSCEKFDPAASGEKLWNDLKTNGKLTEKCVDEHFKSKLNGGAVSDCKLVPSQWLLLWFYFSAFRFLSYS